MFSTVLELALIAQCAGGACFSPPVYYSPSVPQNFGISDEFFNRNRIDYENNKRIVTITLVPSPRTFKVFLVTRNGERLIDYSLEQFNTPPLDPTKNYYYTFKAVWPEGIEYTKKVEFKGDAGNVVVSFDYAEAYISTYKNIGEKIFNFNKVAEWVSKNNEEEQKEKQVGHNKVVTNLETNSTKENEKSIVENKEVKVNNDEVLNFGIDPSFLNRTEPLNTNPEEVRKIEQRLIDDSKKLRFTVIGKPEDRKRVIEDFNKLNYKDEFLVKEYSPEDWEVSRFGFVTTGSPTIYIQQPDGKVLHRQDDYKGLDDLKVVFSKIRVKDPNYDPSKDPDLRKGFGGDLDQIVKQILDKIKEYNNVLLVVGIILLILSLKKKS